jgi:AcrB/AcrD/AcrF family
MAHINDSEIIQHTQNTSRFFVEHRQLACAALLAVVIWGVFGCIAMPQRKDPDVPVRIAVAASEWPGASAQDVEQLITRPIEETIAQNKNIHPPSAAQWGIRSISLPGASFVYVQLSEDTKDVRQQFSDINLKLQALNGRLPQSATPVQFQSDFGDTAALMLTLASPPTDKLEVELRARSLEEAIRNARAVRKRSTQQVVSVVYCFPLARSQAMNQQITESFRQSAEQSGVLHEAGLIAGRGFIGVDGSTATSRSSNSFGATSQLTSMSRRSPPTSGGLSSSETRPTRYGSSAQSWSPSIHTLSLTTMPIWFPEHSWEHRRSQESNGEAPSLKQFIWSIHRNASPPMVSSPPTWGGCSTPVTLRSRQVRWKSLAAKFN